MILQIKIIRIPVFQIATPECSPSRQIKIKSQPFYNFKDFILKRIQFIEIKCLSHIHIFFLDCEEIFHR